MVLRPDVRHKPIGSALLDADDWWGRSVSALRQGAAVPCSNDERASGHDTRLFDPGWADCRQEGQVTNRSPDYIYRAQSTRLDTPKRRGFASKARHAVTRRLARTFPSVRTAIRVADPTEAMLERSHTLLASVQLALGHGVLDPAEMRQLESEAARLRSQAEALLEVVRDLK